MGNPLSADSCSVQLGQWAEGSKAQMNARFLCLEVSWRVMLFTEVRIVTSLWGDCELVLCVLHLRNGQ